MHAKVDGTVINLPRVRDLYAAAAAQKIDWAERGYAEMLKSSEGTPKALPLAIFDYNCAAT